jgi:hypothetical protein
LITSFVNKYIKKGPLLFPLIAVFHIAITLHSIWIFRDIDFGLISWQHPLLLLLYTIVWIGVCAMKKWASYTYIGITSVNLLLQFILVPKYHISEFESVLFPADVLFCFFILVYFKRFE